jgi:hypothetical protein
VAKNWDALTVEQQRSNLENWDNKELSRNFGREASFFDELRKFFSSIPTDTKKTTGEHFPPKTLIMNARRDLSFFEANFELIDNSVDEWRRNGAIRDLHVKIRYDLDLLVGEYEDNAGGMAEADVYKVFIPGETTNDDDVVKPLIGSFGMGAKKAIFRISDGAKVVSCRSAKFSATSSVPEKWESIREWKTVDGRCESIGIGKTRFYFLKLHIPPTNEDINQLVERIRITYAPLLRDGERGKKLTIELNGAPIGAPPEVVFSGATGVEPQIYSFAHEFKNLLRMGHDIKLNFRFKCGLLTKLPGQQEGRENDWGIDVYANGRLIQRFLKTEFGFGTKGLGLSTQSSKFFRGELYIVGHSLGIPWDTHKREYFTDHDVSHWIRRTLRPIISQYVGIANKFSGTGTADLRENELAKPFKGKPKEHKYDPERAGGLPKKMAPSWKFKLKGQKDTKTKQKTTKSNGSTTSEISVTLTADEVTSLLARFEGRDEDDLARKFYSCLVSGVTFTLPPKQYKEALKRFDVETAGELSDRVRDQLLKALSVRK